MLTKIEFQRDYRCFKAGDCFDLKPGLNLLVGDQGSGKSSLLGLLEKGDSSKEIRVFTDGITDTLFFDFEKMNPRKSSRVEKRSELTSFFVSHGESNLEIVKVMNNSQSGVVFLLDEPDQALSIRSCYALVQLFLDVSKRHQIIASVHNPILIECVEEVLSLEHKRIMASKSFIEDHRLNPKATHPVSTSLKRSSSPKKKKPDYGFALLER